VLPTLDLIPYIGRIC